MNVPLEWTHPRFLWLGAAAGAVLWLAMRRSLADLTPRQRRACLLVRGALLLSVLLALTGLHWRQPGSDLSVLFLVDDSASISPEARQQARKFIESSLQARRIGDEAGVVGFCVKPTIWQPLAASTRLLPQWSEDAARAGTDIGRALDFTAAILPTDKARRVVLLSDGNDTSAGASAAGARLAAAGVEVWTVPLRNPDAPEALVAGVEAPQGLKTGEPFDLRADIRSNVAAPAQVRLYQNGYRIAEQSAALHAGANDIRFPNLHAADDLTAYEVELVPEQDTRLENNRAGTTVALSGQPHALLISGDETRAAPLTAAWRDAKIDVDSRGTAGLPKTLAELQRFDLFVLSDVPALSLGREQMELYRTWVQDFGGGFLMIGGENSFGVGGYFRTPIEQMLPVRTEHDDRQDTPSVALYVVLDRSGSMTAAVAGQTKIALANQGAVLALEVLQPRDLFGLTAVDTQVDAVVPLGHPEGKPALEQKILSITAGGGGIYIYTSLVDAFRVMREANARIKHVILFSDAADAEEKAAGEMADGAQGAGNSADLVSAMLAEKITTSVVGLGTDKDKDAAFLRLLAERGNGRFYLTNDALTLPQIFSTETMKVAQSSLVEEPFNAAPRVPSPLTAGIDWASAPLLLGYNATKIKPTAEVLLATGLDEPLLATWRYGLGQAAAFTSDAQARWAGEWLDWDGFGKFWGGVARGLMRKGGAAAFQVRATELGDGNRLQVDIDALTPEGGFRNGLAVNVTAVDSASGQSHATFAEQTAPGEYRAEIDLPPAPEGRAGTAMISISAPEWLERPYVFGHARSYPRESLTFGTDEPALRAIAAAGRGRYDPAPGAIFAPPAVLGVRRLDLTNYFLALTLIILPIDIFLRRRTWRRPADAGGPP